MLSICPNPKCRSHIIENMLEEEGLTVKPGSRKLERADGRNHQVMFQKFGRSLEIKEDYMEGDLWTGKSEWLENAIAKSQWQSVLAFALVGGESNVPRFFRVMIPALQENYGFTDDDLVFFREHLVADEVHGDIGATLLAECAQTSMEKETILEAVKIGARSWWLLHELCDREMRKQMTASQTQ